jgi:hypothetical protein
MSVENTDVYRLVVKLSQLLFSVLRTCIRLISFISTLQTYIKCQQNIQSFFSIYLFFVDDNNKCRLLSKIFTFA